MRQVSGWIRLHVIWVILFSLIGVLLLGSGAFFFIRATANAVHGVLVQGPAFAALLDGGTGKQVWLHQVESNNYQRGNQTGITPDTPLVSHGLVYILTQVPTGYAPQATYTLEAWNLANGILQWSWGWKEDFTLENPPVLANSVIYLSESTFTGDIGAPPSSPSASAYQGFVVALQASDGHQLWKASFADQLSPATITDTAVYVSTGKALLALRVSDGHQLWQYQPADGETIYDNPGNAPGPVSTILVQSQVYLEILGTEGNHFVGDLVALNPQTGHTVWRYQSHGEALTSPILANNTMYVVMSRGDATSPSFLALNASTGATLWTYQGSFSSGSHPTVDNGALYARETFLNGAPGDIVALQASNGHLLKRYSPASRGVFSTFTISQQTLYLTIAGSRSTSAEVIALNWATGVEIWHVSLSAFPLSLSVTVSQNQVYVVATLLTVESSMLIALQADSGKQLWSYKTRDLISGVTIV